MSTKSEILVSYRICSLREAYGAPFGLHGIKTPLFCSKERGFSIGTDAMVNPSMGRIINIVSVPTLLSQNCHFGKRNCSYSSQFLLCLSTNFCEKLVAGVRFERTTSRLCLPLQLSLSPELGVCSLDYTLIPIYRDPCQLVSTPFLLCKIFTYFAS